MAKVTVNEERCKGCGLCIMACPKNIIYLKKNKLNLSGHHPVDVDDMKKCIGCAHCAIICPDQAIEIERQVKSNVRKSSDERK